MLTMTPNSQPATMNAQSRTGHARCAVRLGRLAIRSLLLAVLLLTACKSTSPPARERARLGKGGISDISLSPDGNYLAVGSYTGLYLYRADTFQEVWFAPTAAPVEDVAFSPDGVTLASRFENSSVDYEIVLWDVETGQPLHTWQESSFVHVELAWSPDGTMLASERNFDIVTVRDPETGKSLLDLGIQVETTTFKGDPDFYPGRHVVWSPDGTMLTFRLHNGPVSAWDVRTGSLLHIYADGGGNPVVSPNGTNLVTISRDEAVMWDVETGEQMLKFTLDEERGCGISAAWSPDGSQLVFGCSDGLGGGQSSDTISLWNAETGRYLRTLEGHTGGPGSVVFSPDGATLFSASANEVIAWNVETGKQLRTLRGYGNAMYDMSFSPDGAVLVSRSQKEVMVWDGETGELLRTLGGHDYTVVGTAFSPDGTTLAWSSAVKDAILWDLETGEQLHTLEGSTGIMGTAAFSPDGTALVACLYRELVLWDAEMGKRLHTLNGRTDEMCRVAFSPDGATLASWLGEDVTLWDAKTGERLRILRGHTEVWGVAFSPDTARLVSWSSGQIILWDTETGERLLTLNGDKMRGVTFSPDGKRLISWSDRDVVVQDAETGHQLMYAQGPASGLASAALSPDGVMLVTGADDGTISMWDTESGKRTDILEGNGCSVQGMAFSPDGTTFVTWSRHGTAILWEIIQVRN